MTKAATRAGWAGWAGPAAAIALASLLGGCSPGPIIDRVPTDMGGLPAGAPPRPTTSSAYPAVHDMPPQRATKTLTDEEQLKVEKELKAVRDRQETQERTQGDAPAVPNPKKKPAKGQNGKAGAKTNP